MYTMRPLQIISALASYVEERREIVKPNRYVGDPDRQIRMIEAKEAIQVPDITRQVLVNSCSSAQRMFAVAVGASHPLGYGRATNRTYSTKLQLCRLGVVVVGTGLFRLWLLDRNQHLSCLL